MINPNQDEWADVDAMVEEWRAQRTILVKLAMLPEDLADLVAAQVGIPQPETDSQFWN